MGKRSRELSGGVTQAFDWILKNRFVPDTSAFEITSAASRHLVWVRAQKARLERSRWALQNWLATDNSDALFWVTGKPGSGKSTLMKAVQEHSNFSSSSFKAANVESYIDVEHYFWIAEPSDQRTLSNMFRSLLHGLISALPVDDDLDTLKFICGHRWS